MGHDIVYCPKCELPIMEGHGDWLCPKCGWYYNANTGKITRGKNNKQKRTIMQKNKPCPFCRAKVVKHYARHWRNQYLICYHKKSCFLYEGYEYALIPKNELFKWNKRG